LRDLYHLEAFGEAEEEETEAIVMGEVTPES
jgi:hypothetical protein